MGTTLCKWIDWNEREPIKGEVALMIVRNTMSGETFVMKGSVITARDYWNYKPLAWMEFPEVPEEYRT